MKTKKITSITDENDLQRAYQVANTILQHITYSANASVMMSWGISRKVVQRYGGMDTLFLHVNGFAHKGIVAISLNRGRDLYEIYLLKYRTHECVKSVIDVFCEDLGHILDELIEKPAEVSDKQYAEQVNKAVYVF